jgi:hypothetical protein
MVVVDSSVSIDYFNGNENLQTMRLEDLLGSTLIIAGDLILAKVLQGFKLDRDFKIARSLLAELELVSMTSIDIALNSAKTIDHLERKTQLFEKLLTA